MTYLLDTDHVSVLQRQDGEEFASLIRRIREVGDDEVALCVVSLHEQTVGCHAYINRAKTQDQEIRGYAMLSRVLEAFGTATVLPFDTLTSSTFDEIVARRTRVATLDLRIAAIAISNKLTLLTRNVSDFGKVPELKTENWTE